MCIVPGGAQDIEDRGWRHLREYLRGSNRVHPAWLGIVLPLHDLDFLLVKRLGLHRLELGLGGLHEPNVELLD